MCAETAAPSSRTPGRAEAWALVPAYNASRTVSRLVSALRGEGLSVLVVDDGSADETAEEARLAGAAVLRTERNRGKGAACRLGLSYLASKGVRPAVLLDADLQHHPADAARLVGILEEGGLDVVVGDRMRFAWRMPFLRRLTNRAMSALLGMLFGLRLADTQCGLKAVRVPAVAELPLRARRFAFDSELVVLARLARLRLAAAPVRCVYRPNPASHIRPLPDTLRFFVAVARLLLLRLAGRLRRRRRRDAF